MLTELRRDYDNNVRASLRRRRLASYVGPGERRRSKSNHARARAEKYRARRAKAEAERVQARRRLPASWFGVLPDDHSR